MRQLCLLFFALLLLVTVSMSQSLIQEADNFYELRAENFNASTLLADSIYINQSIALYKKVLEDANGAGREEATWKLMRAYYFKGKYTSNDSELKKRIYDLGKNVGEAGLKEFPNSAGVNLFSAIVWGVWGEEYGVFKAAKQGVAGKIKDRCEKSIAIDPNFDEAGGYRVLGRVYFKAPKIWPILAWPSKEKAVEILRKGHDLATGNLVTKQFLAEALYSQDQKDEAIQIMKDILNEPNIVEGVVEDAVLKSEVKAILTQWQ